MHSRARPVACVILLGILATGCSSAVSPPKLLLDIGSSEIRGGETKTHALQLVDANETIKIELTQHLLDCALGLQSPDAQPPVEVNSPGEYSRRDFLTLEGTAPGSYLISVRPLASPRVQGRYALKVWKLPAESSAERAAIRGELQLTAAGVQFARGTEAGWRESLKAYSQAQRTFADAQLRTQAANAGLSVALVAFTKLSAWSDAARYARESLAELIAMDDIASAALAARIAASAQIELVPAAAPTATQTGESERWREAESFFAQAFALLKRIDDPIERVLTTNQYGILHFYRRRYDEAHAALLEARDLARSQNFVLGELKAAQNLAFLDYELGELARAAKSLDGVAALLEATGDKGGQGVVLDNSAEVYFHLARLSESLQRYFRALSLHRAAQDRAGAARSLHGIGITYMAMGDNDRALGFLLQALPLRESQNDYLGLVSTLLAAGTANERRGDFKRAREFFQRGSSASNTPHERARSLLALSRLELRLHRAKEASELANRVFDLDIPPGHPMFDQARLQRGKVSVQLGQYARAASDLEQARERFAGSHALIPEIEALLALASSAELQGKLSDALLLLDQATARIEQVRERAVNPELRASYLASQAETFEGRTALLMKRAEATTNAAERAKGVVTALLSADRVRARTLRDSRSGDAPSRVDRSSQSQRKVNALLDQIAVLHLQVNRLRDREGTDPRILGAQEEKLRLMQAELDLLQSDAGLPLESSLEPSDVGKLQRQLPAGTALVVYALGERKGWAWVVLHDRVEAVEIPARGEIEKLAHVFHDDESSFLRSGTVSRRSGVELSRAVIEPLLPYLPGDRVLFALDGALHYVPLAALPLSASVRGKAGSYLAERYEISTFGSLAQLAAARSAAPGVRASRRHELLVIADPVFSAADARVARTSGASGAPGTTASLKSTERYGSEFTLSPLPGTAAEARDILALFSKDGVLPLTGFEATRARFLTELAAGARFIHIATHAFADTEEPRLSYIALSGVDRRGGAINGILLTGEIASSASDAELVTLSGCDTHIGAQVFGEGLRGLSHAWILAGARTVVGSLWRVSDDATQALMHDFYAELDRGRVRPARALRAAQLAALRDERYQKPYNWAAFLPIVTTIE